MVVAEIGSSIFSNRAEQQAVTGFEALFSKARSCLQKMGHKWFLLTASQRSQLGTSWVPAPADACGNLFSQVWVGFFTTGWLPSTGGAWPAGHGQGGAPMASLKQAIFLSSWQVSGKPNWCFQPQKWQATPFRAPAAAQRSGSISLQQQLPTPLAQFLSLL